MRSPILVALTLLQLMVVACWAKAEQPQPPPRSYLVGFLSSGVRQPWMAEFERGLRELGYVLDQNTLIEYRFAEGNQEAMTEMAADLVGLGADVIVAGDTPATIAARASSSTVPIVMATSADPVGDRLVESLRRPGGNVTGLTSQSSELSAKRLELLMAWLPNATTVAVLWNASNPAVEKQWLDTLEPARMLTVRLQPFPVRSPEEIDTAVDAASAAGAEALMVFGDPFMARHRERIIALAERHRLPSVFNLAQFAEAGGLMVYGVDLGNLYWRSAGYVDKILRGATPADLPVEQPNKFELIVNPHAADALGLPIPPSILEQANRIVQ